MSTRSVLILVFLMVLVCVGHPRFQEDRARATDGYPVHNLNTGMNYTSVQEAIDANETLNGHTILVDAGTYYGDIILNKSLHLTGQDKETTIIDGNGTEIIITIMADNTSVGNLTVQGGGYLPYYQIHSAIYVNSSNNIIADNVLRNNKDNTVYLDSFSRKNTIENNVMINNWRNCIFRDSTDNKMIGNRIEGGNQECIELWNSSYNEIYSNLMSGGTYGILLSEAYYNIVADNMINDTIWGIALYTSFSNSIYHNNLINSWNTQVKLFSSPGINFFDNGFEGNYWTDYNGTDSSQDGIGDTPYIIDENNTDHYPLMGTFQSFNISITPQSFEEVDVISNFTISDLGLYEWLTTPNQYLQAGQPFLRLALVQEQNMTAGFCRMTLPNSILNASSYRVLIDLTPINVSKLAMSNDTHTTMYFTFNSSALEGIITVPELPIFIVLPLSMMAASLAVIVHKRRHVT